MASDPRKIRFGILCIHSGSDFDAMLERAHAAEELGYETLWLPDHMFSSRGADMAQLEALTLLSALAMDTTRLRLGTLVVCNGFRNPALLAKTIATLDQISRGRLEVGIGAGWYEPEFASYGWDFPAIGARLQQLEESLQIIKAMLTQPEASFEGRDYRIRNAVNNPKPVQRPHPPITIGGAGEKVMLGIVARHADRWNILAGRDLDRALAAFKAHCQAAGRPWETAEISEQLLVCTGADQAEVAKHWEEGRQMPSFAPTAIKGTPEQTIAALKGRIAKGITCFTLIFPDYSLGLGHYEFFAREVMAAFR